MLSEWDYGFAENGLTAYKQGKQLASQSFINWLGEDKYKPLVNFILHYLADLDIPIKRCVRREGLRPDLSLIARSALQWHVRRVPQRHDQRQPHRTQCYVSAPSYRIHLPLS